MIEIDSHDIQLITRDQTFNEGKQSCDGAFDILDCIVEFTIDGDLSSESHRAMQGKVYVFECYCLITAQHHN